MTTTTIQLPDSSIAFYKGVAAGSAAAEQVSAAGGDKADHETRLSFFWLAVGMAAAQEPDLDLSDGDLQALFIRGATTRAPEKRRQLPEARIVDGELLCGHEGCDARIETLSEGGYVQTWTFSYNAERDTATATFDGKWSDDGDNEYVLTCGAYHESDVPFDEWEWD